MNPDGECEMKMKTLWAMENEKLDRKVNSFLSQPGIRVIDLRYDISMFSFSVMVMYEETEVDD